MEVARFAACAFSTEKKVQWFRFWLLATLAGVGDYGRRHGKVGSLGSESKDTHAQGQAFLFIGHRVVASVSPKNQGAYCQSLLMGWL